MSIEALKTAIEKVGGQGKLAAKIGKQQGHIGKWLHRDKKVPAEACVAIEAATDGAVTRYDLRPDVFGPAPDAPPPSVEAAHPAGRFPEAA